MRLSGLCLGLSVILFAGALVWGQTTNLIEPKFGKGAEILEPGGNRNYRADLNPGQKGRVLVIGDGQSLLGVYVYDKDGNCVAWDDEVGEGTRDDLAVQWIASGAGVHAVEVKNFSKVKNTFELAIQSAKYDAKSEHRLQKAQIPDGRYENPLREGFKHAFSPQEELLVGKLFRGGRRACVIALGTHVPGVAFEIQVFDAQNQLVARDAPGHDFCFAQWFPPRDGEYRIVVRNLSSKQVGSWLVFK